MAPGNFKRKPAAILSADVKGYSRLMGEDEEWTLRTLNSYKGLIRNLVGEHRGRVVGSPGDNVLADFASVVDAVECAVEIRQVFQSALFEMKSKCICSPRVPTRISIAI